VIAGESPGFEAVVEAVDVSYSIVGCESFPRDTVGVAIGGAAGTGWCFCIKISVSYGS
jgi:hypothetical protein